MEKISKQLVKLPDGIYDALWSAYRIEILVPNNESVYVKTQIGVRGINCKHKVKIQNKILKIYE